MLGSDSDTAIAPTDPVVKSLSGIGSHERPASVVFQPPPPVQPKENTLGCATTPATAVTRPPRKGPMERHRFWRFSRSKLSAQAKTEKMTTANASFLAETFTGFSFTMHHSSRTYGRQTIFPSQHRAHQHARTQQGHRVHRRGTHRARIARTPPAAD